MFLFLLSQNPNKQQLNVVTDELKPFLKPLEIYFSLMNYVYKIIIQDVCINY